MADDEIGDQFSNLSRVVPKRQWTKPDIVSGDGVKLHEEVGIAVASTVNLEVRQ